MVRRSETILGPSARADSSSPPELTTKNYKVGLARLRNRLAFAKEGIRPIKVGQVSEVGNPGTKRP